MWFVNVKKWCSANVFSDNKRKFAKSERGLTSREFENQKNSDDVHWNVWTNIKTLHAQNNIFKKRIPNMTF